MEKLHAYLPTYLWFLLYLNFRGFCVSLQIESAGTKMSQSSTSLGGQNKVAATLGERWCVTRMDCFVLQTGQGGGSCCSTLPATLWLVASGRKQRGACAASNVRWMFVLRPWEEHREGRLLAQALMLIDTHMAVCKQQPCYSSHLRWKGGEILIFSAKLIENYQCFERLCFTWALQALSILTIPELAVPC